MGGCGPGEEIRTYEVPKEAPPLSARVAASGEPTDRMLAAILPAGDEAWFWKVVGPVGAVDAVAPQVAEFLVSIRPAEGDGPPTWTLPDGWTEGEGSALRTATIYIPSEGQTLELSVIRSSWQEGGGPAGLLANVNRWRRQMQLAPTTAERLDEYVEEVPVGDVRLMLVNLNGRFQGSGMSAPFAGAMGGPMMGGEPAGGAAPGNAMTGSPANLPAGHPPIDTGGQEKPIQYDVPDGWREEPPSGIRKAAFQITNGDQRAEVTVFEFPDTAGPAMSEPLANVNRWRREVGLAPVDEEGLAAVAEELTIGGEPATYTAALPEATDNEPDGARRGTLAAMVTHDHRIWFFKFSGHPDLVASQRDAFRSFLDSIQFATDEGAGDGR